MMTTSAASIAVCVPAPPIVTPMSACASAGASLMPSPAIAVRPSRDCRAWMAASFSAGSRLACTSSMPTWVAMARAVAGSSPVSITGVTPSAFTGHRAADAGLQRVGHRGDNRQDAAGRGGSATLRLASS